MAGISFFFLLVVFFAVFWAKSLVINISADIYRIEHGFLRKKIKEGALREIEQIEIYEGDDDWSVNFIWEDPSFEIQHPCNEFECRILAEDLSKKLNV